MRRPPGRGKPNSTDVLDRGNVPVKFESMARMEQPEKTLTLAITITVRETHTLMIGSMVLVLQDDRFVRGSRRCKMNDLHYGWNPHIEIPSVLQDLSSEFADSTVLLSMLDSSPHVAEMISLISRLRDRGQPYSV